MTRKKMRNQLAKQFSKNIPFTIRHKIAKKLYQSFEYVGFSGLSHFSLSDLRMAEIPYTQSEDNKTIEMYGCTFDIVIGSEWDDDTYSSQDIYCISFID